MLTHEDLKKWIHYDPATGVLKRLASNQRPDRIGVPMNPTETIELPEAGFPKGISPRRLVWFYMTGQWPTPRVIKTLNGNPTDLRWANLRAASAGDHRPPMTFAYLTGEIRYDPDTGQFFHRATNERCKINSTANGLVRISINGHSYECYRLVWLYMTGTMPPPASIYLANGNRMDLRWTNLKQSPQLKGARLTAEVLREWLSYNPETGKLTWIRSVGNGKRGEEAGSDHQGYRKILLQGRPYLAHRLVWLYVHGEWPPDQIDHINMDRSDNRLANLRLASGADNCRNKKKRSDNKSGAKGVCWDKQSKRWVAQIRYNGVTHRLGYFDTVEEGAAAYKKAAEAAYGEFARF